MSGIRASVEIDLEDIALQVNHDDAKKLIFAIDLAQADAEFTEQVIVHLIKSMTEEFKNSPDEMDSFLRVVLEATQ
jgi:hypothetical protein